MPRRRGTTLVELMVTLSLTGALAAVAVLAGTRLYESLAVQLAGRRVAELFALARDHAVARGTRTAVRFDVPASRVVVHAGDDTVATLALREFGDVSLDASRDSMAYAPTGLGFGASNLRLVLSRGASRDTLTVSRLGRVKR